MMSDETRVWCPSCEPLADQIAEMLETVFCGRHAPSREGLDDAGVVQTPEANVTNAQWCNLLHRGAA